jgi:phage terminase large subunit-like protein
VTSPLIIEAARRHGVERLIELFGVERFNALRYEWRAWARPEQVEPPGDWNVWLFLAGRGCGKSRSGAEWIREMAKAYPGSHAALVAPTAADARDVMIKAVLSASPQGEVEYESSKRALRWSNGSTATTYSAEEPDRLRGPNHTHAWADEVCAWQYLGEVWDMLAMTLRIGERPRLMVTTTPRPLEMLTGDGKDGRRLGLLKRDDVAVTRGSTFDNAANLSEAFLAQMKERYEGTRLGDQELHGLVVDDLVGALFRRDDIDAVRVRVAPETLSRVVVAIDPATTSGEDSDETGIVVCASDGAGRGYVLADESGRYTPEQWARKAVDLYTRHKADRIVAEKNQGGDMVEHTIRTVDSRVAYRGVVAKRGKALRAEPVAALYEQRRVFHVGVHAKLETQMCRFMPEGVLDGNDDRVDALVHALTDLMLGEGPAGFDRHAGATRRT